MKHSELIDSGVTPTEIQRFPVDLENVLAVLCVPRSFRDSVKEEAVLFGVKLASYVKMCLIEFLPKGDEVVKLV